MSTLTTALEEVELLLTQNGESHGLKGLSAMQTIC
jgi:hypothetical protein